MIIHNNKELGKSSTDVKIAQLTKEIDVLKNTIAQMANTIDAMSSSFESNEIVASMSSIENATITNLKVNEQQSETTVANELIATNGTINELYGVNAHLSDINAETGFINQLEAGTVDASSLNASESVNSDMVNANTVATNSVSTNELIANSEVSFNDTTMFEGESIHKNDIYFPNADTKIYGEYLKIECDKIKCNDIDLGTIKEFSVDDLTVNENLYALSLFKKTPIRSNNVVGYDVEGNLIPVEIDDTTTSSKWSEVNEEGTAIEPNLKYTEVKLGPLTFTQPFEGISQYFAIKNDIVGFIKSTGYTGEISEGSSGVFEKEEEKEKGALKITDFSKAKLRVITLEKSNYYYSTIECYKQPSIQTIYTSINNTGCLPAAPTNEEIMELAMLLGDELSGDICALKPNGKYVRFDLEAGEWGETEYDLPSEYTVVNYSYSLNLDLADISETNYKKYTFSYYKEISNSNASNTFHLKSENNTIDSVNYNFLMVEVGTENFNNELLNNWTKVLKEFPLRPYESIEDLPKIDVSKTQNAVFALVNETSYVYDFNTKEWTEMTPQIIFGYGPTYVGLPLNSGEITLPVSLIKGQILDSNGVAPYSNQVLEFDGTDYVWN